MAAQLNYNYSTMKGVPGGKYDIAFDDVVTRKNENEDSVMKYGIAVAEGSIPGKTVKVPVDGTNSDVIEGIAIALPNTEHDTKGNVIVRKNASLSIMKKGNIWGRLASGCVPAYRKTAYVVVDGDDAGMFTHTNAAYSEYEKSESSTSGAKKVVASSAGSNEINLADVTPCKKGYKPAVNDYVVSVQRHGAGVDIGAKFGSESDDGIAVIVL